MQGTSGQVSLHEEAHPVNTYLCRYPTLLTKYEYGKTERQIAVFIDANPVI